MHGVPYHFSGSIEMDGRGPWDLEGSIREHQKVMHWYGERGLPVELKRTAPLGNARRA